MSITYSAATLSPQGLYLRPEFLELADYSAEGVERVRARRGEETDGIRVALGGERLDSAAVAVDGGADETRLSLRGLDVIAQESSFQVADRELPTPAVSATILAGTPDTPFQGAGASGEADPQAASPLHTERGDG